LKRRVRRSRPEPRQFWHGSSTIVPFPRQRGHGCESANRPCDSATTPRPPHWGQIVGAVPGFAPEPPQTWQLDAPQRVLEGERDLDLRVGSATAPFLTTRAARAPASEQPAEQVAEVSELPEVEAHALAARAEAHAAVRRAVVVVRLPLLRVGEDVVGRLDLLEALFGLLVSRVLVRVVLPRKPAV
jgi:hypothetical protein